MTDTLFPEYISRPEERQVQAEVERVRADRQSRAVLLYGPGGVGKTWMVRELARAGTDGAVCWVDPIDVDDPVYWLLSNLERHVASRLDPESSYFGPYFDHLNRLPTFTGQRLGHETIVSHLGRIKEIFAECYQKFVDGTGKTVVMVFDTVETIRGMYLLLTLTQWMKALPATLFVLAGRPAEEQSEQADPIRQELEDPYQGLPVTPVSLGDFPEPAARAYLAASHASTGLTTEELGKLVRLSQGHPLWLAFTIAYLTDKGVPQEAASWPLTRIEQEIPYQGEMTQFGQSLHEDFKRRLLTPYRETDFWPEAVKRLAVVRQSISQAAWQRLMSDRPLPAGVVTLEQAWDELLRTPWIRQRANGRYVTLHDAVAEELAQRVIPVHDDDKTWRRQLWQESVRIYDALIEDTRAQLADRLPSLDTRLRDYHARRPAGRENRPQTAQESSFIAEVAELDMQKRELDQLRAARLYYQLLSDADAGCREFLSLFADASDQNDVIFMDLLAFEMQRFLPGEVSLHAFDDVIGGAIGEFRSRLADRYPQHHLEIGLTMADYLIRSEQPEIAIKLIGSLPELGADHRQRYRLAILRGNACLRLPGQMRDALDHFGQALGQAAAITAADHYKLVAKAHKELGFYHRNAGSWRDANNSYQQARDAIAGVLTAPSTEEDREEIASIQTQWAYVKGLTGDYREGQNLVESAITVRHHLGRHLAEGNSWSVCGEVYRYERRFEKAWKAYAVAERTFEEHRNWPWLGLIYQEQAICLFQAAEDGVVLTPGREPVEEAKRLITISLDICRDQAVRSYPSALNRAGRIFGSDDAQTGLDYLSQGIVAARRLSDGWFWLANLTEYAELAYRAWADGASEYFAKISEYAPDIDEAHSIYRFPDLEGRWLLLQGHLAIHRWHANGKDGDLALALSHYRRGFALIAQDYVGSSGASAIPAEFRRFRKLFGRLPPHVREHWQVDLRQAWSTEATGSTLLLARLEELF